MSTLQAILTRCRAEPERPMVEVLASESRAAERYVCREVLHAATVLAERVRSTGHRPRVGALLANGPEWVVADLALLWLGATEVPIPLAFSAAQAQSLLAHTDLCLVDAEGARKLAQWWPQGNPLLGQVLKVELPELLASPAPSAPPEPPTGEWIAKVVHTSGTTSAPKGVEIRARGVEALLTSLRRRVAEGTYARYLSLVPLSLLIEQVTALYLTFLDGGTLVFLPRGVPLLGDAGGSARGMLSFLPAARPSALTLPPSMVEALHAFCRAARCRERTTLSWRLFGRPQPAFLACGGAPTSPETLRALSAFGLEVYEGYGLSENSSVVSWNSPGRSKPGTVGTPLDHVEVRLAPDGELLIRSSSLFAGYTTEDPSSCQVDPDGWLRTGDLADIDAEGFIRIRGRKKNVIVTANGRNVSPEWVESRYQSLPGIEKAVIFGEGLESLLGFFVVDASLSPELAALRIDAFGREHLSEVERVERIVTRLATPELYQRLFTVTGRPRREEIWAWMRQHVSDEEPSWTNV